MRRVVGCLGCIFVLLTAAAVAQEDRSEVSALGMLFITRSSSGDLATYSPPETGGFIGTYRYHLNHRISAEAAYGYTLNTQKFSFSSEVFRTQARVHQATAALVVNLPSRPRWRFDPYVLAGAGALVFAPVDNSSNTTSGAQTQAKPAFLYGAGLNYAIRRGISLRAEYRGLVYSAPDFGFSSLTTHSVTHTAVPTVGISFRF